ncbi:MAG: hypothetical protein Q3963_05790, partial [Coriobacteriaceae bacterium]|nr:hypothetical protein [Coriobacteriaceae bacterium]
LIGGDEPPTFNTDGEDMLGESLPPRSYRRDFEELDKLFGPQGAGFTLGGEGFDDLLGGPAEPQDDDE